MGCTSYTLALLVCTVAFALLAVRVEASVRVFAEHCTTNLPTCACCCSAPPGSAECAKLRESASAEWLSGTFHTWEAKNFHCQTDSSKRLFYIGTMQQPGKPQLRLKRSCHAHQQQTYSGRSTARSDYPFTICFPADPHGRKAALPFEETHGCENPELPKYSLQTTGPSGKTQSCQEQSFQERV